MFKKYDINQNIIAAVRRIYPDSYRLIKNADSVISFYLIMFVLPAIIIGLALWLAQREGRTDE